MAASGFGVACKAADGKSVCAFPDVCMTPPECPATPPGVPVPYPNTAYAKDTAAGSKTVKISGKPVILKNKSYFKKSTGDEAGCASKKGVVTGVNRGKAYFTSWSMDVKVEGYNVCRHLDSMTHNHASYTCNTGVWKYIDTKTAKGVCKKDVDRVNDKCQPMKEEEKEGEKSKTSKRKSKSKIPGKKKKPKMVPDDAPGAWKESYCKGLEACPPTSDKYSAEDIKKKMDELLDVDKQLEGLLEAAKDKVCEKVQDWAVKKGLKLVAKSAVKGWLGPIGWVWTAYDAVSTGLEIAEMWEIVDEMTDDINNLKNLPEKIEKIKEQGLTAESLADAQAVVAEANPCLKARKCMLVPKQKSKQSAKYGDSNSGCCGGQTGHHLIPESAMNDADDCKKYNGGEAPTVCAEGTSHSRGGSHEALHTYIEDEIKRAADANGEMTYGQSKNIALNSHKEVFGHCDRDCLEAQLDKYHKEACNQTNDNFKVKAKSAVNGQEYKSGSLN